MTKHATTDPACIYHREPRTWFGRWRYNRARGRNCPICVPPSPNRYRYLEDWA